MGQGAGHVHPPEQARRERHVGVVEHGAHPHRAGLAVQPVLGEVENPLARGDLGIGEGDLHLQPAAALVERGLPRPGVPGVGEVIALVDVEVEMDRVDGDDAGQDGLVLAHEVAGRHPPAVDAPGDGGVDLGVFEVDAGLGDRLAGLFERAAGGELRLAALVDDALGDVAVAHQRLGAGELVLGEVEGGARDVHLALGLGEIGAELALVDGEQQVAGLDQRAVLEVHRLEIAADAGADLDLGRGVEAADELVGLHDVARHGMGHGHRGGGLLLRRGRGRGREGQQRGGHQRQRARPARGGPRGAGRCGRGAGRLGEGSRGGQGGGQDGARGGRRGAGLGRDADEKAGPTRRPNGRRANGGARGHVRISSSARWRGAPWIGPRWARRRGAKRSPAPQRKLGARRRAFRATGRSAGPLIEGAARLPCAPFAGGRA